MTEINKRSSDVASLRRKKEEKEEERKKKERRGRTERDVESEFASLIL